AIASWWHSSSTCTVSRGTVMLSSPTSTVRPVRPLLPTFGVTVTEDRGDSWITFEGAAGGTATAEPVTIEVLLGVGSKRDSPGLWSVSGLSRPLVNGW